LHSPFLNYAEFSDQMLKDFLRIYTKQFIDQYFECANFNTLRGLKQIIVGIKLELDKREKQAKTPSITYSLTG